MAALSIAIGITAIVLAIIPIGLTQLVGVSMGLLAVILGVMGRKRATEDGRSRRLATAGLVMGISGTVLSAILFSSFIYIMDRVSDEVEGASAAVKQRLGEELAREFGRERGTAEFHKAMERVIQRASELNAVK